MTNSSKECQWVTCLEHLAQTGTESFNYSFTNCSILWFKITNLWFKNQCVYMFGNTKSVKKAAAVDLYLQETTYEAAYLQHLKKENISGDLKYALTGSWMWKNTQTPSIAPSWFDKNSSDKMHPLPFFKSKMHETCTPTIIYFKSWTFDKLRISQQEARARLQSCMIILSKMWEKNSSHPELFDPRAKAHNEPGLGSHCIKRNGTHFTWRKQTMSLSW